MSEAWPPAGWTSDDCLAWLGADLGKAFGVGEARDAVGRWVAGGGAGRARRRKGAINLAARLEGQRTKRTIAKRTLSGEDYHAEADAIHAPEDGESDASFQKKVGTVRRAEQKQGKVVLEADVGEDDDDASIKEKLMDSYDADRRNKPGWLAGRAAVEDRKHVENAVDHYLSQGAGDFEDGEVLHVSVARSDDARFHDARAKEERHLKVSGMSDGDIDKELSGEADEARDAAKAKAAAAASNKGWNDSEADLAQAYPKEHAAVLALPSVVQRAGARERLTRRFVAEQGRKPGDVS